MKKTIFKSAVVLLTAIMTISCSKDGATGPAGATGAAGTNGINGNANVLGSTPFSTVSTNWTSLNSGTLWTANLTGATSITQNVVDKGIVSVFRKYTANGVTEWSPLPDTNANVNISFNYGLGYITFYTQSTDFAAIPNPGAITFRYVVITPSNKMANPNTNWNDYEQVKEVLHLQD
jgi:hypothetical protein